MKRLSVAVAAACLSALPAHAASSVDEILAANKAAMGNWDGKETLEVNYAYKGQGLEGSWTSLEDLKNGAFVDGFSVGPDHGTAGFDGERAWEKEISGAVTRQEGGDVIPLDINESYGNRNLWWRPDHGGAEIAYAGKKVQGGKTYEVLSVTPKGGKTFTAWFDSQTHLLDRTDVPQSTLMITTRYSDYRMLDGAMLAHNAVIDDGSGEKNLQYITLATARFSPARPLSDYQMPKADLKDYSLADGAFETTVPMLLANNHVYVDASVNGGKALPFIVDTGGHDIVTPPTAKLLGIRAVGSQTSTGGGADIAQSGLAGVQSIKVGKASLNDQVIRVLSFGPEGAEGAHEAGMIGYEFFARFVTRFDYGNRTVTFIDKKHFDPKDAGTPVPIMFYHQLPVVEGSYDGIPARFGIDTGSRMVLELTGPFAKAHGLPAPGAKGAVAITGWGVGGKSSGFVQHGGMLKMGDVAIDHPQTILSLDTGGTSAAEAFPNNVGGGLLKRFVVTFDYDHYTMYLKPIAGAVPDLDTFDRSGMWVNGSDAGLEVVDVTKGGPAEAAGIKAGDTITTIDGKPAMDTPVYLVREAWRNEPVGTMVELGIGSGKAARKVRLTLKDQV